jgi:hypothetical protein
LPPPVNNYSIGGDINFNTGQAFNINGADYDLYTVALHEIGHSLGLGESSNAAAVMYATYNGLVTGLASDDVAGIQNIYSSNIYSSNLGRSYDAYNGLNTTSATAADITSSINASTLNGVVSNLNIATLGQVEYFKVTAPAGTNGTMTVIAQSSGLSLLTPSLKIYNSNLGLIGSVTGTGSQGSTLTKSVSVTAGQVYYIRVAGATTLTPFGTGLYALGLNFGTNGNPTIPLPSTQTANGNPLQAGGGLPQQSDPDGDVNAPIHKSAATTTAVQIVATAVPSAALTVIPTASSGASPASVQAVAAAPVAAPAAPLIVAAHMDSGGGDNQVAANPDDAVERLPLPAAEPSDAVPASFQRQVVPSAAEPPAAAPASALDIPWRDACTACFVGPVAVAADTSETADPALALAVDQTTPAPDAASTAAALAVALAVSAGLLPPRESDRDKR